MKKTIQHRWVGRIGRAVFVGIILWIATAVQTYWAMKEMANRPSASCLDCAFVTDVFSMSLLITMMLSALLVPLSFIKNKYVYVGLGCGLLILFWFFANYSLFADRESAWSTYLFWEEVYYVVRMSWLPILVLCMITLGVLYSMHTMRPKTES